MKGPEGGKLFKANGFGVEVTIFEEGVPPQFRLYLSENGKPLPPSAAKVTVTLLRLGAPAQVYTFKPQVELSGWRPDRGGTAFIRCAYQCGLGRKNFPLEIQPG